MEIILIICINDLKTQIEKRKPSFLLINEFNEASEIIRYN